MYFTRHSNKTLGQDDKDAYDDVADNWEWQKTTLIANEIISVRDKIKIISYPLKLE